MKILFFGDIDGKIGRAAVAKALPIWRKQYRPDVIIANADNVTHGKGMNKKHANFFTDLGVDIFTAGDHTLEREETLAMLAVDNNLQRPANLTDEYPGQGDKIFKVGKTKLLVISLLGTVFIDKGAVSPFFKIDEILKKYQAEELDAILVDFHAEATSEKSALAWYVDGRVSAILGTHTHVQTADERILPHGTAAITDVGFCGAVDSVIGVAKEEIINHFLTGQGFKINIPEKGLAQVNAVYLEVRDDRLVKKIIRLNKQFNIG